MLAREACRGFPSSNIMLFWEVGNGVIDIFHMLPTYFAFSQHNCVTNLNKSRKQFVLK